MGNKAYNKKVLFFIVPIVFFLAAIIVFLNSFNALVDFAETLDKPSSLHSFLMSRVYSIADDSDIQDFIKNSEDKKYQGSINSYIRVASVVGGRGLSSSLTKIYIDLLNNKGAASTLFYSVNSLGLSGNAQSAAILKRSLGAPEKYKIDIPQDVIARSIYILTGERVSFKNVHGQEEQLFISPLLSDIREVLVRSQDRERSYDERLILDKLFQPPQKN